MQRHGMGQQMAHGMFVYVRKVVATHLLRRCGLAQSAELRPRQGQTFGQGRDQLAAVIDYFGNPGLSEAADNAGVKLQRLQAPCYSRLACCIAVMFRRKYPRKYGRLCEPPSAGEHRRVAREEFLHVLVLEAIPFLREFIRHRRSVAEQGGSPAIISRVFD